MDVVNVGYAGAIFDQSTVKPIDCTINPCPTDLSRIIHINETDRWLHLGLAIVLLAAGFLSVKNQSRFTVNAFDIE